jgi:hypothetical protein
MPDKDELERLKDGIKKANNPSALKVARDEYIRLLEQDDWRVATRALNDAKPILRSIGVPFPTECALIDKILILLKENHPIKAIGMGEPQGVHGIAHVLKGGYLNDLYIKIKVEDRTVVILSFHQ